MWGIRRSGKEREDGEDEPKPRIHGTVMWRLTIL